MSRLIDADALKKDLDAWVRVINKPQFYNREETLHIIDKAPTVEPKRGEWKTWEEQFPDKKAPKKNGLGVFCSACQLHADNMFNFCPNCGADMRENEKE